MDILQQLPLEKWHLLRETLKEDWPNYAYYHGWVTNAIKWKTKDPEFKIDIFCPDGKHDTGVFVGILSDTLYSAILFTLKKSRDLLKKVLSETQVIDWHNEFLFFPCVHDTFADVVENYLRGNNRKYSKDTTNYYFLPKEDAAQLEFEVPEECRLGCLDASHVEKVHSVWPHRLEKNPQLTIDYLKTFIVKNRGLGLFLKKDDTLVSWILQTDWSGLGMFQTDEDHKRKGFGKVVLKAMVREIAVEDDLDSFLYIIEANTISTNIFESLGYKTYGKTHWFTVDK